LVPGDEVFEDGGRADLVEGFLWGVSVVEVELEGVLVFVVAEVLGEEGVLVGLSGGDEGFELGEGDEVFLFVLEGIDLETEQRGGALDATSGGAHAVGVEAGDELSDDIGGFEMFGASGDDVEFEAGDGLTTIEVDERGECLFALGVTL
jgi:hypothetical protein